LNKLIPLLAFSILLLVPIGAQEVFANHPQLACPPPGILNSNPLYIANNHFFAGNFCFVFVGPGFSCPAGYNIDTVIDNVGVGIVGSSFSACTTLPQSTPDPTHPDQCQGASILVNNHCFAQALSSIIGGELLDINTVPLLVGAIGVNPVITGLAAITMGGVAAQAIWYVNSRRVKKVE